MTAATSRIIQRALSAAGPWTTVGTVTPAATTYQDTGLTNGTEYFYRVISVNAEGNSPPSNVASATPQVQFTPDDISDLVFFVDARDMSSMVGVTGNGDVFSEWTALQSSTASAYIFGTNAFEYVANYNGGGPAVKVNGAATVRLGNGNLTRAVTQDEQTLFCVASSEANNGVAIVLGTYTTNLSGTTSRGGYTLLIERTTPTGQRAGYASNTTPTYTNTLRAAADNTNSDRAVILRGTGSGGVLDGWINGASVGAGQAIPAGTYYQSFGASTILNDFASTYGNLHIRTMGVYNRALTAQEIADLQAWTLAEFGV